MLKHAADLSAENEYFIVWAGGTNSRPHGAKADAYSLFPEFELAADGLQLLGDFSTAQNGRAAGVRFPGDTSTETLTLPGAETVEVNEWAGTVIRRGSNIAPLRGGGLILSNTASSGGTPNEFDVTVFWGVGFAADDDFGGEGGFDDGAEDDDCNILRENRKWGSYPQVRVLTPYQPVADPGVVIDATNAYPNITPYPTPGVTGGRSLTLPTGYNGATGATAFEDVGVLLPLTFFEGLDGFGISEVSDSTGTPTTHAITDITGDLWTFAHALDDVDYLTAGYVLVDWELVGVPKRSWAPILAQGITDVFQVGTWSGDGDPTVDTNIVRYTAWVPHFNDSPYAYAPGENFAYPNHDMMPCADTVIGANVHNRPRGIVNDAYEDRFGALLVAAARLSAAIGKRVNVVNLGVTSSSLSPSNALNPDGFAGQLGWWKQDDHGTWAPSVPTSIYARMNKLLRDVLPNAMTAEANTADLYCLGIVFAHGEADAQEVYSRQDYSRAQKLLVSSLRSLIDTLGYNPYANGAEIPFVQPRIGHLPYVTTYDTTSLINSAIEENTVSDEFASSVRVDDLPRLSTDSGVYSGVGEAALGARIGDTLSLLVDHGLGFGSTVLATTQTRLIDICNLALSNIGDGPITSLSDGSTQAAHCVRFLPDARDELLRERQWGFALRRRQLMPIQRPEQRLFQHWEYCYVMPDEAQFAFNVFGPASEIGTEDFDYTAVTTSAYATTFIANGGSSVAPENATASPVGINPSSPTGSGGVVMDTVNLLPILSASDMKPQPYAVEQSPFGHRYIFTNQPNATLQYVSRVVDADQYSATFASALAANLGSKLASVIIKGDEGEKVSMRLLQKAGGYVRMASSSDANEQRPNNSNRPFGFKPDHMRHRVEGGDIDDRGGGHGLDYYSTGFRVL